MNRLKKYIKEKLVNRFGAVGKYFPISKTQILYSYFGKYFINKNNDCVINFIVTSKAEIRVFTPIINFIVAENLNIKTNLFFTNNLKFNEVLTQKIDSNKYVNTRQSGYFLLKSLVNKNSVNIICLDQLHFLKHHKTGIEIIDFLNKNNAKTICIQHGGNQEDNIIGHNSSISTYQIVFGKLIYDRLINNGFDKSKIYLTGNPLHDDLFHKQQIFKNSNDKKNISLITCLHTEYDDQLNPLECYTNYLKTVVSNIDFSKYLLIIKMHPNDSLKNNIYKQVKSELKLDDTQVKIIEPDNLYSVYELILSSDLIISRASSIIEEALMIGKKVIAYDIFNDGPSAHYDFLNKYKLYKKVTGKDIYLNKIINDFMSESIDDKEIMDQIVANTTFKLDGKSSERIIDAILKIAFKN